MFPGRDGDSEQRPRPNVVYGEEHGMDVIRPSPHLLNSQHAPNSTVNGPHHHGISVARHSLQQYRDLPSMEQDHDHATGFHQQFQLSSLPLNSPNSASDSQSLTDHMVAPYKPNSSGRHANYILSNMDEDALLMNPASSSSSSFLQQADHTGLNASVSGYTTAYNHSQRDQILQSLQRSNGLLPASDQTQLQLPREQLYHPLSNSAGYGIDHYNSNNGNNNSNNHVLMSLRAGNYSYGGSGSSSKNQFYGTGNYSLPYPFDLRMLHDNAGPVNKDDLHELRQAEYGAILSPLQQAALPSAYSNSVLSKTLENIGRSTGSYSAATANANASTALTATGTLKPMGARDQSFEEVCTPRPRWCPTQEQIQILESLFISGTTTPSRDAIVDIAAQLRKYGTIAEANVFYWFQNRKARAKRKLQPPPHQSQSHAIHTGNAMDPHQSHPHHQQNKQPSSSSSSADHRHHHHHQHYRCDSDASPVELVEMKKKQQQHKSRKVQPAQKPRTNSNSATRSTASNTTASGSEQSLDKGSGGGGGGGGACSSMVTPYPSLLPAQLTQSDRLCSSAQTPSSVNSSALHLVEEAISEPTSYNVATASGSKNPDVQVSIDSACTLAVPSESTAATSAERPDHSTSSTFLHWPLQQYVNQEERHRSAELHHHSSRTCADHTTDDDAVTTPAARHPYDMNKLMSFHGSMAPFFRRPDAAATSALPSCDSNAANNYGMILNTVDHSRISLSLAPPAQHQLQTGPPPLLQDSCSHMSASDHNSSSPSPSPIHPHPLAIGRSYEDHPPDHQFLQATMNKGFLLVNDTSREKSLGEEEAEEGGGAVMLDMAAATRNNTYSSSSNQVLIPAGNNNCSINTVLHDDQNVVFPRLESSAASARPLIVTGFEFNELGTTIPSSSHLHPSHSTQSSLPNLGRSSERPKLRSSSPMATLPSEDHLQLWEEIDPCGSLSNWPANAPARPQYSPHESS